jgi:protoporphyrinogen oxidase
VTRTDAIVLGAGPAGLGAALALVRAGLRPTVVEAGAEVGGLCRTVSRDGFLYDLGGHILFVRDEGRRVWLEELLGDDLVWVNRPVAHVENGSVKPGRYLDLGTPGAADAAEEPVSGYDYLAACVGADVADRRMRPYLEKIDGMPLERIPAARVERLMVGQSAPGGFWFCRRGIAQLMRAMAAAITSGGGRILLNTRAESIDVTTPNSVVVCTDTGDELSSERLVVGVPPSLAARLVTPAPAADVISDLQMRAVCLVYLALDRRQLTEEPWIQVDNPHVPFSRLAEMRNWSVAMVPDGQTVLCAECYCFARDGDPVWSLDDAALAAACTRALVDPLRLLGNAGDARLVEVVRFPAAYPMVPVADVPKAQAPWRFLDSLPGVAVAQGGAVIEAIEAGERAALVLTETG